MIIDLGKKPVKMEDAAKPSNKPYYPSAHVTGIDADLSAGDEVTVKCRVKRPTEEDDGTYSCDLELISMEHDGGDEGGLDGALSAIQKKKIKDEADAEGESEEEETTEKEEGDTDDE